jgi:hypothetical protein
MLSPCCWRTRPVGVSVWLNAGSHVGWTGRRDQECRQGWWEAWVKTHIEHSELGCAYLRPPGSFSCKLLPDSPSLSSFSQILPPYQASPWFSLPIKLLPDSPSLSSFSQFLPPYQASPSLLTAGYLLPCVVEILKQALVVSWLIGPGVCFGESLWKADSLGNQSGQLGLLTKGISASHRLESGGRVLDRIFHWPHTSWKKCHGSLLAHVLGKKWPVPKALVCVH